MIKPPDPMDPIDFRRAVTELESDMEYGTRVYIRHGEGERLYRIVSVDVDDDGDLIVTTEP